MSLDQRRLVLFQRLEEVRDLLATAIRESAPVALDQTANGRLTRMDAMQQAAMASARRIRLENEVRKLQAAIERLEEGTYGLCCRCGVDIPQQRLTVDPAAPFCAGCSTSNLSLR